MDLSMKRREITHAAWASLLVLAVHQRAQAYSFADLTDKDASSGLKGALESGAMAAISLLGKTDGFLGNPKVKIPLPGFLEDAAKIMKTIGQGKKVDELVISMNRAAETAVPMAKDLLVGAVKSMTVTDAKNILQGGDTSVTKFFADKTREPLTGTFLPVVTKATEKVGLAQKYNAVAAKGAGLGLVKKEDANIEKFVTGKTLDGLYLIIGEEEKKLRQNPAGAASDIVKKVFGLLK
jgi:Protein of unknown function (DUF4197)